MPTESGAIRDHAVVPHVDWVKARLALLEREKAFSRARDELNRARREMPWELVDKSYVFETPDGKASLGDLFAGKRQLVVYHFMFAPDAKEGCKHCSFWAEHFDSLGAHLGARDTRFVAISRAPLDTLRAFQTRMGWQFPWYSSGDGDFNYDLGVSFKPEERAEGRGVYNYVANERGADREGLSVFYKDEAGRVLHTYSSYARGIDLLNTTYNVLDLTPKGRDEEPGYAQAWVRLKDRYPR